MKEIQMSKIRRPLSSLLLLLLLGQDVHSRLHEPQSDPLKPADIPTPIQNESNQHITSSDLIPSLDDTIELGRFSSLIYAFKSQNAHNCSAFDSIFHSFTSFTSNTDSSLLQHHHHHHHSSSSYPPPLADSNYTCHLFKRNEQDTQVMVVSRTHPISSYNYVAIVYAGTDDFRNALTDTNIRTKVFGPQPEDYEGTDDDDENDDDDQDEYQPFVSSDIRVHAGFNNAVFKHGLYPEIRDTVLEIQQQLPTIRIVTTGHSLGAADAILTAVALKVDLAKRITPNATHTSPLDYHYNATQSIVSLNFGSPKTGNGPWREFVNSIPGLGIWRMVRGVDLVPRMPGMRFHHVGHTVQLDSKAAGAYWLHNGDHELGYRGVPFGWNTLPYALAPAAAYEHLIGHYTKYLSQKSNVDPEKYYINHFEAYRSGDHDESDDDDGVPSDDYYVPPENGNSTSTSLTVEEYLDQYAEQYLKYCEIERALEAGNFEIEASLQIL